MWKTTVLFGVCLAVLLALLKWLEYSFFIKDMKLETYLGIVGLIFTFLGIWIGWKLTHGSAFSKSSELTETEFSALENSIDRNEDSGLYNPQNEFNLSPREHEVLVLIARGLSYQEIADQLSESLSTIKTHVANIFSKLDVQRRTQAVMVAQKRGLLPPLKV